MTKDTKFPPHNELDSIINLLNTSTLHKNGIAINSKHEDQFSNLEVLTLSVTVELFILFIGSAATFHYFSTDSLRSPSIILYFLTISLALIFIAISLIHAVMSAFSLRKKFRSPIEDVLHKDLELAKRLLAHGEDNLDIIKEWLDIKVESIDRKTKQFFGEKIAYTTLALGIIAAQEKYKIVSKLSSAIVSPSFSKNTENTLILFGVAFIVGVFLGYLLLNVMRTKYFHLQDTIKFAQSFYKK